MCMCVCVCVGLHMHEKDTVGFGSEGGVDICGFFCLHVCLRMCFTSLHIRCCLTMGEYVCDVYISV